MKLLILIDIAWSNNSRQNLYIEVFHVSSVHVILQYTYKIFLPYVKMIILLKTHQMQTSRPVSIVWPVTETS